MSLNLEAVNCYRTINLYYINVAPRLNAGEKTPTLGFLEQLPGFLSL